MTRKNRHIIIVIVILFIIAVYMLSNFFFLRDALPNGILNVEKYENSFIDGSFSQMYYGDISRENYDRYIVKQQKNEKYIPYRYLSDRRKQLCRYDMNWENRNWEEFLLQSHNVIYDESFVCLQDNGAYTIITYYNGKIYWCFRYSTNSIRLYLKNGINYE